MFRLKTTLRAFTLIELLIVVAIIAILAAIAVPNFLEAQVRAKVSRAKSDMRTIHTGLEAYRIDANKYPKCSGRNWVFATEPGSGSTNNTPTLERLTTPISYLAGKGNFQDPFIPASYHDYSNGNTFGIPVKALPDLENKGLLWYTARNSNDSAIWTQTGTEQDKEDPSWWMLQASGPDRAFDLVYGMINPWKTPASDSPANRGQASWTIYDPTNGTVSRGSIWRVGGAQRGAGAALYNVLVQVP